MELTWYNRRVAMSRMKMQMQAMTVQL